VIAGEDHPAAAVRIDDLGRKGRRLYLTAGRLAHDRALRRGCRSARQVAGGVREATTPPEASFSLLATGINRIRVTTLSWIGILVSRILSIYA
jgi:hypothetical protein